MLSLLSVVGAVVLSQQINYETGNDGDITPNTGNSTNESHPLPVPSGNGSNSTSFLTVPGDNTTEGNIPVPSNMTGNGSILVPSNTTGNDSLPDGNGSIPVPSNMTGNGSIPVPSNTTGSDSLPTSRFATSLEATQKDTTVESENTHSTWLVALVGSFSGLAVVVAVVTYRPKRVSGPQETALVEELEDSNEDVDV
eukprot:TRINITY_DN374_c0_g1_i5.p1 TRINITY_DN374_c0_g1~~TRINITY_DN374_c0_g1_i5.p1  ORF type:complete len:204 (+),score=57.96 TRINITY_DN374_c0_g1_i5:25-612(+)